MSRHKIYKRSVDDSIKIVYTKLFDTYYIHC